MEYIFTGECRWAKVYEPDTKYGPTYSIEVKLDDDSEERYKTAGCMGVLSKDGAGYRTFRRRENMLTRAGKLLKFGPPVVQDENGDPFSEAIGNGSRVAVKVFTFKTEKGIGTRLEGIRVLEWLPFSKVEPIPDDGVFNATW